MKAKECPVHVDGRSNPFVHLMDAFSFFRGQQQGHPKPRQKRSGASPLNPQLAALLASRGECLPPLKGTQRWRETRGRGEVREGFPTSFTNTTAHRRSLEPLRAFFFFFALPGLDGLFSRLLAPSHYNAILGGTHFSPRRRPPKAANALRSPPSS